MKRRRFARVVPLCRSVIFDKPISDLSCNEPGYGLGRSHGSGGESFMLLEFGWGLRRWWTGRGLGRDACVEKGLLR